MRCSSYRSTLANNEYRSFSELLRKYANAVAVPFRKRAHFVLVRPKQKSPV